MARPAAHTTPKLSPPGGLSGLDRRVLVAVAVVLAIIAGAIHVGVALFAADGGSGEAVWSRRVDPMARPADRPAPRQLDFGLADVTLGMTIDGLRRRHPDAVRRGDRAVFEMEGGRYTATFAPPALGAGIYRLGYEQTLHHLGERAIHARLGRRFGHPATSDCDIGQATRRGICRFRWWPAEGVRLNATLTEVPGRAGGAAIHLAVVATDTLTEGKMRRAGTPPETPPQRLTMPERLPF